MQHFYTDVINGDLPSYSFIEPRWFQYGQFMPSDQHPPHDVEYGEYLMADIYEALRRSSLWNSTLFIVTYDEHGGFYDHVPTPLNGVPNPDGLNSVRPPFDFTREGVRVPFVAISPWLPKGIVIHGPTASQMPSPTSVFEHSSVPALLKSLFNLPSFLTKRDAWAANFFNLLNVAETGITSPRTDCPTQLWRPGTKEKQNRWRELESLDENLIDDRELLMKSGAPLSHLQREVCAIAAGVGGDVSELPSLITEHDGSLFVRRQWKKYVTRMKSLQNENNLYLLS